MAKRKSPVVLTRSTEAVEGTKSKAQIVQDYKAANPDALPKDIAEALGKQGIEITPAHVSSILSHAKAGNGGSKGGSVEKFKAQLKLAGEFAKSHGNVAKAIAAIESVGGFIDSCGGSEAAKAALASYKELAESLG